jgi:hypothetical protein
MELAPKPPPKPPSSSSSDDSDPGPQSSDDEGMQEEMDVLEKLYLVGACCVRVLASTEPREGNR